MPSAVLLPSLLALAAAPGAPSETFRFHADHVLGTSFDMAVTGTGEAEARFAFAAARAEITRLERRLSGWQGDSELSVLNRADTLQVSDDLFAVIAACEIWRTRTGGAFSARLGEVEGVWTNAAALPDTDALCAAAARAETATVGLDATTRTVARPAGVTFAVDGLAKGYIIDAALAAARRAAPCAEAMMVDIGGDMACWGAWTLGVANPDQLQENAPPAAVVRVTGRALAVSGPGARDRMIDGAAHSHLLDPRTGQPTARRQAAVLAPTAVQADALATALAVMTPREGLVLAGRLPDVEAMIIENGKVHTTAGWASCQVGAPLPANFQVEVAYELPRIEVGNYRKPYVVAWITDADKNLVRNLTILGAKQDYQEDNYVWWRRYGRKQPGVLDTMAKPTRAPGRYTIGWDGLDETGKRAPQGHYIVHIEASREHGGHTYQTLEVDLGAKPTTAKVAAKDELGAAQVRYAKRK